MSDDFDAQLKRLLMLEREGSALVLWHRTPAAAAIVAQGWRDIRTGEGFRGVMCIAGADGVYVSNRPLGASEGAKGREVLRIVLAATEDEIAAYEIVEESGESTYREWCIPAAILNSRGRSTLFDDTEESLQ